MRKRTKKKCIYIIPDWKCRALDSLLAWFDTILWRTHLYWDDPNSHCNVQSYGSIDEDMRLNICQVKKGIRTFQLRLTEDSSDWGNRKSTGDEINHSFSNVRIDETNHGPPKFLFARDILPIEIKWHHPLPALKASASPIFRYILYAHIQAKKTVNKPIEGDWATLMRIVRPMTERPTHEHHLRFLQGSSSWPCWGEEGEDAARARTEYSRIQKETSIFIVLNAGMIRVNFHIPIWLN